MEAHTTLLMSDKNIAKCFDTNGHKLKAYHFVSGVFRTYLIRSMWDLKNLILQIQTTSNQCLMLGVFDKTNGHVITKAQFDCSIYQDDVKTRTKLHVNWHNQSLLMFDYDYLPTMNENMQTTNFQQLYSSIMSILPEFENVEMLFKFSSSSNIYDVTKNQYVSQKIGIHVYFAVKNCNENTVKNFVLLLKNRLKEHNLYQMDADGKVEYLFDMSVFSQEREIIETKPILPSNLSVYELGNEMRIFNDGGSNFDLNSIDTNIPELPNISKNPNTLNVDSNTKLNYLAIIVCRERVDYKIILALLDGDIVSTILRAIGYSIYNMKFKLRDEKTPSVSIMHDTGYINDFGGSFKGTILQLLVEYHNLTFKDACSYLFNCFREINNSEESSYGGLKSPYEVNKLLFKNVNLDMTIKVPDIKILKRDKKDSLNNERSYNLEEIAQKYKDNFRITDDSMSALQEVFCNVDLDKYKDNVDKLFPFTLSQHTRITIGYSFAHSSLTVTLFCNSEVKTVAIRRNNANKKVEQWEKWKKYGSMNYIPFNILSDDKTIYVAFGMMEIALFEILGLSYIVFQSDEVARDLQNNDQAIEILLNVKDKNILIFCDNDESCINASINLKRLFGSLTKSLEIVNFEYLVSKKLNKGYDLIDYVNEYGLEIFKKYEEI